MPVAKRKVSNLMALAVLVTVYPRPMHRYEMASMMRAHGKDRDLDVKWGSLYTVVQNLEKHGFLEAVGTSRQGARPERVVYRITDAGIAEMRDWTRELLSTLEPDQLRFAAGLSVMTTLPPGEVISLLQARLAALHLMLTEQRAAIADYGKEVPRMFLIEDEYRLALGEAEEDWIQALVDELSDGTFPGLSTWQSVQETGEMPDELRELWERGATPEET
jgi:DNA-binding PadR family transcriptional regulator